MPYCRGTPIDKHSHREEGQAEALDPRVMRATVGDDPDVWLRVYLERVFAARLRAKLIQKHGPEEAQWPES